MQPISNDGAIAAIILAAGASTRMGTPKQLLQFQGQSLLRLSTETAIAARCNPVFVVLGASIEQIQREVSALPVQVVENREWRSGMGSSIRVGVQALLNHTPTVEAAILLLCDQPFVSPQLIQQLKSLYCLTHQPIIASTYQNTIGVPALFDAGLFSELIDLNQLEGAKTVIERYVNAAISVDFPQGAIDLDTLQEYQHCLENSKGR